MLYVAPTTASLRGSTSKTGVERFRLRAERGDPEIAELSRPRLCAQVFRRRLADGLDAYFAALEGGAGRHTGAGGKAVFALDVTAPRLVRRTQRAVEINSSTAKRAARRRPPSTPGASATPSGQAVVATAKRRVGGISSATATAAPATEASLYVVAQSRRPAARPASTPGSARRAPNGLGTPTAVTTEARRLRLRLRAGHARTSGSSA